MTDFLATLLGGTLFIAVMFLVVHRFSRFSGQATAVLMALLVIIIYVPYSIIFWSGGDVFAIHIAIYLVSVYVLGIMSSQWDKRGEGETRGFHWAPTLIVLFFVVVVSVDSVLVMLAQQGVNSDVAKWLLPKPSSAQRVTSYFPGTVNYDFHQRSAEYNALLHRIENQQRRNWNIKKGWLNEPQVNKSAIFRLELRDAQGEMIRDATIEGKFMRPGNTKMDQSFNMQQVEPGVYQVALVLPQPGNWSLLMMIHKGDILHELMARTQVADSPH